MSVRMFRMSERPFYIKISFQKFVKFIFANCLQQGFALRIFCKVGTSLQNQFSQKLIPLS